MNIPSLQQIVDYEMSGSCWAERISRPSLQTLAAKYFVWKASRKYRRYLQFERLRRLGASGRFIALGFRLRTHLENQPD